MDNKKNDSEKRILHLIEVIYLKRITNEKILIKPLARLLKVSKNTVKKYIKLVDAGKEEFLKDQALELKRQEEHSKSSDKNLYD
jgi:Mn-dependent DtxR family transcriptional regulator